MNKIKILLVFLIFGLCSLQFSSADNWVCYDSTSDCHVTEADLRAGFPSQTGSPLQKICSGSTEKTTYINTSFIRGCSSTTFEHCPENEYFLASTTSCKEKCIAFAGEHTLYTHYEDEEAVVYCGLGGSPHCSTFETTGDCDTPSKTEFVCGKDNDSWQSETASNWQCPTCKELAIRQEKEFYGGVPNLDLSSFKELSFDSYTLYSNTTLRLTFMLFIEACINRVPMANLNVSLIDNFTKEVVSTETGIYAKHKSLNYSSSSEDGIGLLEYFDIPKQEEFRKNYTLKGEIKAYRPWAWRKRLVDAIKTYVEVDDLTIPGYPSTKEAQRIGNLYYSTDFLAGKIASMEHGKISCDGNLIRTKQDIINVLNQIPKIDSREMCTIDNLTKYYADYGGMTTNLSNELKSIFNLDETSVIKSMTINKKPNEVVEFNLNDMTVDVTNLGYASTSELLSQSDSTIFNNLIDADLITVLYLKARAEDEISSLINLPKVGCGSYNYRFEDFELKDMSVEKHSTISLIDCYAECETENCSEKIGLLIGCKSDCDIECDGDDIECLELCKEDCNATYGDDVDECMSDCRGNCEKSDKLVDITNIQIKTNLINDIITMVYLDVNTSFDCELAWSWESFADLEPENLSKCLYNWDKCILNPIWEEEYDRYFYEVADCGMGPPSNIMDTTLKDAARGNKTIEQIKTVYRTCDLSQNWISSEKRYACVEGQRYKCKFGVSVDDFETNNVNQTNIGDVLKISDGYGYVCANSDEYGSEWRVINCSQ